MHKIHQTIFINAPREKVWDVMLSDDTYRAWTQPFHQGSYFKGDWSEGSKMLFLGPSDDGSGEGGMVSMVKENRRPEFISLNHIGVVNDGVEDTTSEATQGWIGVMESYAFAEKDGGTELTVDTDTIESMKDEMEEGWRKGLEKLKELAEK